MYVSTVSTVSTEVDAAFVPNSGGVKLGFTPKPNQSKAVINCGWQIKAHARTAANATHIY